MPIYTIDLNFQGQAHIIACYLIPHAHGGVLVECGPTSTVATLQSGLKAHGLKVTDITDVFVTHIHLDHAGSVGWWARQGARIHVHPNGAPHLLNPEKLIASAVRIYGDQMGILWGELLPVDAGQLIQHQDGDMVTVDNLLIEVVDTPGHANHHFAYLCQKVCFTGDVGGVRLPGVRHLRLPTPPPEFHLETWRATVKRLRQLYTARKFSQLALAHFGIYNDPDWHLEALVRKLDAIEAWMNIVMPTNPPAEWMRKQFIEWEKVQAMNEDLTPAQVEEYASVNTSSMSADGLMRYWRKFRVRTP